MCSVTAPTPSPSPDITTASQLLEQPLPLISFLFHLTVLPQGPAICLVPFEKTYTFSSFYFLLFFIFLAIIIFF